MSKHNQNRTPIQANTIEPAEKTIRHGTHPKGYIECPGFTGVYLRTGEGTDHDPITVLLPAQRLTVLYYGANWSRVALEDDADVVGYIQTKFLCVERSAI